MARNNYWAKIEANQCYHIYNHAVGTENLFKKEGNETYFLKKWDQYISPYFTNYAYCLLPNHFHFLSKAKPIGDALKAKIEAAGTKRGLAFLAGELPVNVFYESQFASFFKSYTNSINRQEPNRYGSLFKAKFRRTLVRNQSDFLHFLCYIHHNPIHHHLATDFGDWPFSSFNRYLTPASNSLMKSTLAPDIAIEVVLKLFQTANDPIGIMNFKSEHHRFGITFRGQ